MAAEPEWDFGIFISHNQQALYRSVGDIRRDRGFFLNSHAEITSYIAIDDIKKLF